MSHSIIWIRARDLGTYLVYYQHTPGTTVAFLGTILKRL